MNTMMMTDESLDIDFEMNSIIRNDNQISVSHKSDNRDWAKNTVWWHLYPLGFCGAPIRPGQEGFPGLDAEPTPRLRRLINWLDFALDLGINGLILGPIFASTSHGYDTLDHFRIDPRLGTERDFDDLVAACQERGIAIVLDGVFSHVSTYHPWLRDDMTKGQGASDLFDIDWNAPGGPRPRVWEGHGGLARLNHNSETAKNLVSSIMLHWLARGVDGWRLDAAYSVPQQFWAQVIPTVRERFPGAWFLGEVLHGDYASYARTNHVDSVTQYELWKSIWSSILDSNLFELDWTLKRHNEQLNSFVPQTFIGNHDVTRIATKIGADRAIAAAAILFTVGGIPSIYAGDELGYQGVKENREGGDDAIRPAFPDYPDASLGDNPVYRAHRELLQIRRERPWLTSARTSVSTLQNKYLAYQIEGTDGNKLSVEIDLEGGRAAIHEYDQTIWAHHWNA